MNPWLVPFTLPTLVQSYVLAMLSLWAWWGKPRWQEGILLVPWRPYFAKRWRPKNATHAFTTTIGFIMGYDRINFPTRNSPLWYHEVRVHVAQYEDANVLGAILALCLWPFVGWIPALAVWASSGPLWYAPGYFTALARYRKGDRALGLKLWQSMYYRCEIERSAYSQTRDVFR